MKLTNLQIDTLARDGILVDANGLGYDYANQTWIKNGRFISCDHPENMNCQCYGKLHYGELVTSPKNNLIPIPQERGKA